METPLTLLVYVSAATKGFSEEDLPGLLRQARLKNRRLGGTGLLLYEGGNFIQVLEGPTAAVDALYETIARDARHHRLIVLLRTPATERRFARWAMGFRARVPVPPEDRPALSDYLKQTVDSQAPGDPVDRLLRVFRQVVRLS